MKQGTILWISLLVGTIFSTSIYAAGTELILTWEFDHTYQPAPEQFLVTYTSTADQGSALHQFTVPNQGQPSCSGVKGLTSTPDSVCGRPPGCLPPGMAVFWVQADLGGTLTEKSNIANCLVEAGCKYTCTDLVVPPEIQHMVDNPPADLATLQALLQQIPQSTGNVTAPPTFTPPQLAVPTVASAVPG